jgi:tetratricopeptide (TPR) repeat protein
MIEHDPARGWSGAKEPPPGDDSAAGGLGSPLIQLGHLSAPVLRQFMTGDLPAAQMRHVLRHLLQGCTRCQTVARAVWNLHTLETHPTAVAVPQASSPATVQGEAPPLPQLPLSTSFLDGADRPSRVEPATAEAAALATDDRAYDAMLDRVFARVVQAESMAEAGRRRANGLVDELMQHPPAHQRLLVHNSARFRDRRLCENFVAASHKAGFQDPARSVHFARLAVEVAERLAEDPEGAGTLQAARPASGEEHVAASPRGARSSHLSRPALPALPPLPPHPPITANDPQGLNDLYDLNDLMAGLRARAWAQLGNALRTQADLEGAASAFDAADAVLAAHPRIGAIDKARVLDLKASWCREVGQFDAAERLLDRVIAIYRRLGQSSLLGHALNQKAMVLTDCGRAKESTALLRRALALIDQREDPRRCLQVRHNLIVALLADDRPREAFALLFHTRPLYLKAGDRPTLLRLRWLEGRVAHALGRVDQAEAAYREVREAFVELGMPYDAALVTLDVASVLAQQGKTADLRQLAIEMMAFFESRQIHREAMAAFLLFCEAARQERAGVGLVREISTFLQRARNAPSLKFSPPDAAV